MSRLSEIGGKRLPFLRWSVWRMAFGARNLLTNWQVGDGREEALARHVVAHARPGDLDDATTAPSVVADAACSYGIAQSGHGP